ncbi:MAG: recombinase family protein [Acidocella sp.]|nr:recombinase family protein [Acidocella sp.]
MRSLAEPWADTTPPAGRMMLTVFAGIADFERSLIVERTSAGRISAKARGVRFGLRPTLAAEQIAHARELIEGDGKPVAEVARFARDPSTHALPGLGGPAIASLGRCRRFKK